MEKEKNRLAFIDVARGIAIILMVIGHVLNKGIKRNIIFSFHMPLFIITSGFFYKEKSFKEEIKNLVIKLLIPTTIVLFIVSMIKSLQNMGFIDAFIETLKVITVCWSHKSKINYDFPGTGVLWFVYLLIGVRILFWINKKISKENEFLLFLLVIIETYIGYLVGIKGYWLPWSIDVTFASMLFYYIGYILKKYEILDKIFANYKIILLILIIWIIGIKYSCIEIAIRKYPEGLWTYIVAVSGSLIVLKISQIIEYKLKYISKALAWCGKNSLFILYGHYIESYLIKYKLAIDNKTLYKSVLIIIKTSLSTLFALVVTKPRALINCYLKRNK